MWFLSGIVMMYVGFPRVTETERLRALEPIAWSTCCRSDVGAIAGDDQILAASVENLGGSPALTLRRPGKPDTTLDLARQTIIRVNAAQAQSIALDAASRITGRSATPEFTGQVQTDQWTVGRLNRDRPLFRFELDGEDIRGLPLGDRKKRLARLLGGRRLGIVLSDHTTEDGATIFRQACKLGMEGVVSKRLSAPYRSGPSRDWIKIKNPDSPAMIRAREAEW
jgi:hypothetical protein